MSPEEAARRWIAENNSVWEKWMPACAGALTLTATTPDVTAAAESASADPAAAAATEELAKKSNCLACHGVDKKLVGPAFKDVAAKYKGDTAAVDVLFDKVKNGGSGSWGAIPMPPNPTVSEADVRTLVEWVLSL